MSKQPEQWREVLALLREGSVTPLQCWVDVGCYRAADAIEKLRKRGYVIETKMMPFTTTRGRKIQLAHYTLIAEPENRLDRVAHEAGELMGAM